MPGNWEFWGNAVLLIIIISKNIKQQNWTFLKTTERIVKG